MRESVLALEWDAPVTHVVHTDDPRDAYVEGDIVVRGEALPPAPNKAPYNEYNNRLLRLVPDEAWVVFIDDDDEYASSDVMKRLIDENQPDVLHIGTVDRGKGLIYNKTAPRDKLPRGQHTEAFAVLGKYAKKFKWPQFKAGDKKYSREITRVLPVVWHPVLVARAVKGRGVGRRQDIDSKPVSGIISLKPGDMVQFRNMRGGLDLIPYHRAKRLEERKQGRITYKGVQVEDRRNLTPEAK